MPKSTFHRKPVFFWQGLLIVLPVAALAIFGFLSLRQERLVIEQEAKELGESLARRLAQAVENEIPRQLADYHNASLAQQEIWLTTLGLPRQAPSLDQETAREQIQSWQGANPGLTLSEFPRSRLNANGPAIHPYSSSPSPPSWPQELTPDLRGLWKEAQDAEFIRGDIGAAQSAIERFLAGNPSAAARANAEWILLALRTRELPAKEASAQLFRSEWARSGQLAEGGLPVGQLLCYRALRLLPDGAGLDTSLLQTVAWAISSNPSSFSAHLIAEAERAAGRDGSTLNQGVAALRAWWNVEEKTGRVLRDFKEQHPIQTWNNTFAWAASPSGKFLIELWFGPSVEPATSGFAFFLYPEAVMHNALAASVMKAGLQIPRHLSADLELAGVTFHLYQGAFSVKTKSPSTVLGEANGYFSPILANPSTSPFRTQVIARPSHTFRLRVSLMDPQALYARQQGRIWLFGGLIGASALTALLGLTAAYRAFNRQLQLNEMKSNFVSSVSHELRAPIASVRLMAESLERGKITGEEKQREYFHFIVQECRRLTSLIENVLDSSRIERGCKQYEFEPADLAVLARETIKLMEPSAAERSVRLEFDSADFQARCSNLELKIDAKAMQQALVNLIDNAIKHSPAGGTVTIGLNWDGSEKHPIPPVKLFVEDQGEGIPPDEHEKIFERFYRLGSEMRRESQGTGIGLSIVKHVVEAHGGRVRVRSSPGNGSRFTIEIPVGNPPSQ